jgi:hypothetical protein
MGGEEELLWCLVVWGFQFFGSGFEVRVEGDGVGSIAAGEHSKQGKKVNKRTSEWEWESTIEDRQSLAARRVERTEWTDGLLLIIVYIAGRRWCGNFHVFRSEPRKDSKTPKGERRRRTPIRSGKISDAIEQAERGGGARGARRGFRGFRKIWC